MDREAAIDDLLELLAEWLVDDFLATSHVPTVVIEPMEARHRIERNPEIRAE